jgi:glycosyltransferase involved in cell wall biosynthesis
MVPWLSVIVICHNMRREAPRTLHSLSRNYQRGVEGLEYEVLVVDNGSSQPLEAEMVTSFGPQFRYHFHATDSVSPVSAINWAVTQSRGEMLVLCIDGARILSPGMLKLISLGARLSPYPLVATLAWQLGEKIQRLARLEGYSQEVEDRLLDSVDWRSNGYELFKISCLGGSSSNGWFHPISESSCLALPRVRYEQLDGYDSRFMSPGGGFANLDFYKRACDLEDTELIILLGEGSFHQIHGGAATGMEAGLRPAERFGPEYESIRGRPYRSPVNRPIFLGSVPVQASPFLKMSAEQAWPWV